MSGLIRRRERDSNPRSQEDNGFQDHRIRPLCHLSGAAKVTLIFFSGKKIRIYLVNISYQSLSSIKLSLDFQYIYPMNIRLHKTFILALLALCLNVQAQLDARLDMQVFKTPDGQHFLESYLHIYGHTLNYSLNENEKPQAKIQITQVISKGEEVVDFKKYDLLSPEIKDSLITDLKDIQRFTINPGEYTMELKIMDLYDTISGYLSFKETIEVNNLDKGIQQSGLIFLESIAKSTEQTMYTRSGVEAIPLADNFFSQEFDLLAFYTEVYNSPKVLGSDGQFVVRWNIYNADYNTKVSGYSKTEKYNVSDVVPLMAMFDIKELPNGNYYLQNAVISRAGDTVSQAKHMFHRLNPLASVDLHNIMALDIQTAFVMNIENEDSMNYYIQCLRPLCSYVERDILDGGIENESMEFRRKFFFAFWKERNPMNPEEEWERYKMEVWKVENLYSSSHKHGFETDRGRVYLKYGPPSYVEAMPNEPSSYPYEIWQYYHIGRFNNKRFIFYLPDLVTNDYVLLHSDLQGEPQNHRWRTILVNRNTPFQSVDAENGVDHFGGDVNNAFNRSK